MSRSRSYTRTQLSRIKSRARRRLRANSGSFRLDLDTRFVGMSARTPHPCSCGMCRNPRRLYSKGLTRQETRADLDKMDSMPWQDAWTVSLWGYAIHWLTVKRTLVL